MQTFPDHFTFKYNTLDYSYKMIGNVVPVELAKYLAISIKDKII
ncbi:DNA cytosine methyltransferase [Providencia sp. wls1916]